MKTFRDLLQEMDEPERSQAIANTKSGRLDLEVYEQETPASALHVSFHWSMTKEGHAYWNKIAKKYADNESI